MATIRSLFNRGVQDKESDRSAVPNGATRHVENLRFHTNDGHDGIGVNIRGSLKISDVTEESSDLKCIGAYFNEDQDVIYYKLASTDGQISIDAEYDIFNDNTTLVLKDTNGILKYNKKGYITGWNEINGLQFWSEDGNNPRRINTERAKAYGVNGFTEDDITVIVKPPFQKLRLTLEAPDTESQEENFIIEKFLSFSYRHRYLDGEYSVLAPFTLFAFHPKKFNYDYAEQSNRSMVNYFNQVNIEFNTGNERVVEIQLVFKHSESKDVWIIHDFNKALLGFGHNEIKSHAFFNNKVFRALSNLVLPNIFDNVPRTNQGQTMIDGRLIYSNYLENYNIIDCQGNEILLDYKLELNSTPNTEDFEQPTYDNDGNEIGTEIIQIPTLFPKRTCKSNRDYEVGIVYGDDYGRITTILNSEKNTLFIANKHSVSENKIDIVLKNKPPCWATYFRFFVKQNKKGYDQVLPTLFYEDGVHRWVKLEGADRDKVREGDYLIVKSDTQEPLEPLIKVKVLEVKDQPKDFLESNTTTERAGLYFKIKPRGFRMDIDDLDSFEIHTYDNTRNAYNDPIRTIFPYTSQAHFYGDTLDDMESNSIFINGGTGAYAGANDERARYLIKIDSLGTGSTPDTFKWSEDEGASYIGNLIPITAGTPQALNKNIEITFENANGHSQSDEWIINGRGTWSRLNSGRAYAFYRTTTPHITYETIVGIGGIPVQTGEILFDGLLIDPNDETIYNGARIVLEYDEYGRGDDKFKIDHISSGTYDNIQEWFHKEDILSQITSQCALVWDDIHFMRGVLRYVGNATEIAQDDVAGTMTMCIRSVSHGTGSKRTKVKANTSIVQNITDNVLLFETEPTEQPENIYFEVGKNYKIRKGFHSHITDDFGTEITTTTSDQTQTATLPLRITLDWFNAFCFGNAVESYKLRDDFNKKGLDIGVRPLSNIREKYKETRRKADCTWSDVYNDDTDFNGLNTFNLSQANFVLLDKEDGSIQKLFNTNGNLLVYQEDAVGLMPYNKNIIYDTKGGAVVGVSKNILNKDSYRPYANGLHGISLHPESFVAVGGRKYSTDAVRGDLLRLSINGITEINQYQFEHWFSNAMEENRGEQLLGGYDPKHKEYYLYMPKTGTLVFTEKAKGFPFFMTIKPDFMLNANNEFYAWKDGVMYRMNATETRNNFFGNQYKSLLRFFVNEQPQVEKIFKAIGLESTHAWLCKLATKLTSREIPKEFFNSYEDYWYAEIMGNTNNNTKANSIFGIGSYPIVSGVITMLSVKNSLSIGDTITSKTLSLPPLQVIDIQGLTIILSSSISVVTSFLMYSKNQSIDGSPIRGDILEVEMISDETEKVEIRAVRTEVIKSNFS